MQNSGHPLFADSTYGGDSIRKGNVTTKYKQFVENCFTICHRQALHARMLGFIHPRSGKKMVFESPLPTDFADVVEKWRHYHQHVTTKADND
jgi:23S rRNA pseudouridine1911/1915/1917 synthase